MNQESEEFESGELFDESFDLKEITWKIPNALDFPDKVDYKVDSPTFSFAGATWKLRIFPFGQTQHATEGYVDLMIIRLSSRFTEQKVFCKFCFQNKDGNDIESRLHCVFFKIPPPSSSGVLRLMTNAALKNMKDNAAPNYTLTIVCQMRTQKVEVLDISQTEARGCDCVSRQSSVLSAHQTLQDFKELFLKQEDCDVTLKVQGKEFRAHKAILVARSPVFASTFKIDMKEKASGVVNIEDCDPSSFADFLCFLYCGIAENMTSENVYGLFMAADKYDVKTLRLECLEFMKNNLSVGTFCETVTLAFQHLEKELIELTCDFFAKHLQEIIVTVEWQRFLIEYPVQSNEIMIKALVAKKE